MIYITNYSGDFIRDISTIFNEIFPMREKPINWKTITLVGNYCLKLTCLRKVA